MEPSSLALFWAGVIVVAILMYVILDGFDLGIGILFGTTRTRSLRDEMMAAIAPFWDGNETWLVVVGTSLFAAFPTAYAVFLPAFYIPVLLLLFGLMFRGVAFEFRHAGARKLWHTGFYLGSAVAAFVQGAAVGAMIRGIPVANGQYVGGAFDWLAPLPILCGIGLVLGYALLGAGWLVLKCEGALRDWARRRIPGSSPAGGAGRGVRDTLRSASASRPPKTAAGAYFPPSACWRWPASSSACAGVATDCRSS
jgi:cytochrome d ubiquinol oxidase subunit II